MPADKQNNGTTAKPFTPSLSSHFRSTKSPLTPKMAGTSTQLPSISPRREIQSRTVPFARDTKSASPLNGNITPRSGPRNSKIGIPSPSTPRGNKSSTPVRARDPPINDSINRKERNGTTVGLGISSSAAHSIASVRSPAHASTPTSISGRATAMKPLVNPGPSTSAQFFRADEARPTITSRNSAEKPRPSPKTTTSYSSAISKTSSYAVETAQPRPKELSQLDEGKFFFANDLPAPAPQSQPAKSSSTRKASSSSGTSLPLSSTELRRRSRSSPRPSSPLKELSSILPANKSTPPRNQPSYNPSNTARDAQSSIDRRKSFGSVSSVSRQLSHTKAFSTGSTNLDLTPTRKKISPQSPILTHPALRFNPHSPQQRKAKPLEVPPSPTTTTSPRSTSLTSSNTINTTDTELSEPILLPSPLDIKSPSTFLIQPPPKLSPPAPITQHSLPNPQTPQDRNELAASARRERKVLDLEISNSSLLAINKTLEREMRKQSAELRRFRRLSRSGRLSLAPGSMRAVSGASALSTLSEDAEGELDHSDASGLLDDLGDSASDEDEEDDDLDSTLSAGSNPNNSISPTSGRARQRARDEKRLMLDLAKHQQLLVDSQKMNQSIRRCVGWADDMIREGSRALEYRVGIGDVRLGGRVLIHDEDEDADPEGRAEVTATTVTSLEKQGTPTEKEEQLNDFDLSVPLDLKKWMEEAMLWTAGDDLQALLDEPHIETPSDLSSID